MTRMPPEAPLEGDSINWSKPAGQMLLIKARGHSDNFFSYRQTTAQ